MALGEWQHPSLAHGGPCSWTYDSVPSELLLVAQELQQCGSKMWACTRQKWLITGLRHESYRLGVIFSQGAGGHSWCHSSYSGSLALRSEWSWG